MPRKRLIRLPEALCYLQPFVNWLATLPADELNEDIDPLRLEQALRRRLRGLGRETAERELAADRVLLESWLKTEAPSTHPAYWLSGYLQGCLLWADFPALVRPQKQRPAVVIEAPEGWKSRTRAGGLLLKKGMISCPIRALIEQHLRSLQLSHEERAAAAVQPDVGAVSTVREVQFGDCVGRKYLFQRTGPVTWKEVNYVLRVPGGCVTIFACTKKNTNFDESPLEARFHTLRILPPT